MPSISIQALWGAAPVILGSGWFLWQRFQNLDRRLRSDEQKILELRHDIDGRIKELEHSLEIARQANQSNHETATYLINSNTNLVNHRSERIFEEIRKLETRIQTEIRDIKGFLDKTTDFNIRGAREQP